MSNLNIKVQQTEYSNIDAFCKGAISILPLSIAVLPWGVLAGSMAVNAGLTTLQSIAMSVVIFAGAAQLVSLGLIMSGASLFTIIITVFFLTSQHFIYALKFRADVIDLPVYKRLIIGFLLTDELFAVGATQKKKLTFAYMSGAGFCFYLAWCLFSACGVFMAKSIPNLENLHLDFSIIAVFILLIIPLIKNKAGFCGVMITMCASFIFKYLNFEAGTVVSGILGMITAVLIEKKQARKGEKI